jgi:phosphoglycolate phosphatase
MFSFARKKTLELRCNLCGGTEFVEMNGRQNARCAGCSSLERTRLVKLHLDRLGLPCPHMRILHIAPERGLAKLLSSASGYEAADLDTTRFGQFPNFRQFDMGRDAPTLPKDSYDLIMHNHVLEHIEYNFTAVLYHLHRALKPDGYHIFSIPFESEFYEESLAPLSKEERHTRFGQWDHVRSFGTKDLANTLGMAIRLPQAIDLEADFPADVLDAAAIPRSAWKDYSKHFIFVLRKSDLLLRDN